MEGCSAPAPLDMDEVIVKGYISRMLSDNYTLLIIFMFVVIILVFILKYFYGQAMTTYKDYKKNTAQQAESTEEDVPTDPTKFQDPGKLKFYETVSDVYKEYNIEKTKYVKSTYQTENTDVIDDKIAYARHDNYDK